MNNLIGHIAIVLVVAAALYIIFGNHGDGNGYTEL
jgi:hypothetical protein